MNRPLKFALLALAPIVLFIGCNEATSPDVARPSEALNFLRPAPGAPAIADTVVSFWAKRGEDREVRMRYAPSPGSSEMEDFLRLSVPAAALERRPDGSAFAVGDSVLITVRVVDPVRMVFDFQPSGLRFSAKSPARLRIEYGEADDDIDGDGDVDDRDLSLETQLSVWRQEAPGQLWYKVASVVFDDLEDVEADILGFSGYALAY
ncbi:MAG: hypothetical protein ABR499_13920 [Gemmatimonadaceae bacterium]